MPMKSFKEVVSGELSLPSKIFASFGEVQGFPTIFILDEDMRVLANPFSLTLIGRREFPLLLFCNGVLYFLVPSVNSTSNPHKSVASRETTQPNSLKFTPELSFQIKLHAFLLWTSIGVFMPIGILIIRMANRAECGKRLKVLFYSHVILQIISVLLATGAAVLSLKNFENSFNNTHQRVGLVLYGLIWVQPLIGFLRPHRGEQLRSVWYTAHWLLGTATFVIGTINVYIGLHAYEKKTSTSTRLWTVLFTTQLVFIGFIYLLQDKWDYIKKQGVILGNEQISPNDQITYTEHINQKELPSLL